VAKTLMILKGRRGGLRAEAPPGKTKRGREAGFAEGNLAYPQRDYCSESVPGKKGWGYWNRGLSRYREKVTAGCVNSHKARHAQAKAPNLSRLALGEARGGSEKERGKSLNN